MAPKSWRNVLEAAIVSVAVAPLLLMTPEIVAKSVPVVGLLVTVIVCAVPARSRLLRRLTSAMEVAEFSVRPADATLKNPPELKVSVEGVAWPPMFTVSISVSEAKPLFVACKVIVPVPAAAVATILRDSVPDIWSRPPLMTIGLFGESVDCTEPAAP